MWLGLNMEGNSVAGAWRGFCASEADPVSRGGSSVAGRGSVGVAMSRGPFCGTLLAASVSTWRGLRLPWAFSTSVGREEAGGSCMVCDELVGLSLGIGWAGALGRGPGEARRRQTGEREWREGERERPKRDGTERGGASPRST